MRGRRNRRGGLFASPFVVMTDMTIGLAFFFAVFSVVAALANSQAVQLIERQGHQVSTRNDIVKVFQETFESAIATTSISGDGDHYTSIKNSQGTLLAEVWENGNFQRVKIFSSVFQKRGRSELSQDGSRLYRALGSALKANAPNIAYLFLHGIVEPTEVQSSSDGRDLALNLSRERADRVFKLMSKNSVIGSPTEQTTSEHEIPRKYAIAYGTGTDLYTRSLPEAHEWNSGRIVGRVDLVLFYKETNDRTVGPRSTTSKL